MPSGPLPPLPPTPTLTHTTSRPFAGAVHGMSVLRLLCFLTWNNQEHLRLWVATLLREF